MSQSFPDAASYEAASSEAAASEAKRRDYLDDEQFYDFPELQPFRDVVEYAKEYAREKPEAAALWCFGVGFILGWKLKPW